MNRVGIASILCLIPLLGPVGCSDGPGRREGGALPAFASREDRNGDGRLDWVVRSGDTDLVFRSSPEGFDLALLDPDGALAAEAAAPCEIWSPGGTTGRVVSPSLLQSIAARAEAIEGTCDVATPGGGRVRLTVSVAPWVAADSFAINLGGEVALGGSARGVHQRFSWRTPEGWPWSESEFLLPGFWVKHNSWCKPGGPSERQSHVWSVREDRLSYPEVLVHHRTLGRSLVLLRADRAANDSLPPSSPPHEGEITFGDGDVGPTEVAAVGFADEPDGGLGRQRLSLDMPFVEEEKSYQRKDPILSESVLTGPVTAFFPGSAGTTWSSRWIVQVRRGESGFQDPMWGGWRIAHDALSPRAAPLDRTEEELKRSLAVHFSRDFVDGGTERSVAGYYTWLNLDGEPFLRKIEPSALGMTFLTAKLDIERGRALGDPEAIERGLRVFDSWSANGTKNDLFYDAWIFLSPGIEGPFNMEFPFLSGNYSTFRREAEDLFALALVLREEQARGFAHPLWDATLRLHLDRLLSLQAADGSFARSYERGDGAARDPSTGGCAVGLLPLVEGYLRYGDPRLLEAARRLATYTVRTFVEPVDYWGSTPDSKAEDKEAAVLAFLGLRLLHGAEPDPERSEAWLDAAERAAQAALTWYVLRDIPMPLDSTLERHGLGTTGLGTVSAENNHLDVYLLGFPGGLVWLSRRTGNPAYEEMARILLLGCLQYVRTPGHEIGIEPEGVVPEVILQTWWDFGWPGKGSLQRVPNQWTNPTLWFAIDDWKAESGLPLDALGAGRGP